MKAALVDPHAVGLEAQIGDVGIEIAIAIEIAEGDVAGIGVADSLTTVGKVTVAIIDPHAAGLGG